MDLKNKEKMFKFVKYDFQSKLSSDFPGIQLYNKFVQTLLIIKKKLKYIFENTEKQVSK